MVYYLIISNNVYLRSISREVKIMEENKIDTTPKISSQEEFQRYYEDGIRKAKTVEEFGAFVETSQKFEYKPEITAKLFLLGIQKSAELTTKTLIEEFRKLGRKE